jgi:hypothetical protein
VTVAAADQPDKQTGGPTPAGLLPGLAAFLGILLLAQHGYREGWPLGPTGLLVVAGLFALRRLWRARHGLLAVLASVPFSAAILAVIAVATALGTFVPQGPPASSPGEGRPGFAAHLVQLLFLDDLFGSLWFGGLLALLGCSLTLAVLRRPFWRMPYWGFALGHGGMVLVLLGAAIGWAFGVDGQMHLRVGETTNQFSIHRHGIPTGHKRTLDFSLKLDAFDVDRYPRADPGRLAVYRASRGEEQPPAAPLCVVSVADAGAGFAVPDSEFFVRVLEYYPDAEVVETMEEAGDPALPSAVQVRLRQGELVDTHWLVQGIPSQPVLRIKDVGVEWGEVQGAAANSADAPWTARTVRGSPARHLVSVPGRTESMEVRVGETYRLPGGKTRFEVAQFYPDFFYDIARREAYSVSDQPRNPALRIDLRDDAAPGSAPHTRYLFSGEAGHMGRQDEPDLAYRYEPPVSKVAHLFRVDGRSRQWAYATGGREVLRRPFEPGKPVQVTPEAGSQEEPLALSLEVLKVLAHARVKREARTLSREPRRPAVLVEVRRRGDGGPGEQALLVEGDDSWMGLSEDLVLALEVRKEEVKSFRSRVTVIREGRPVEQAVIAVNAPLSFGGYLFYQSDYRPQDPGFSGLKVVRNPGLGVAYMGMLMVCLGITYTLYVRPRLHGGNTRGEDAG